MEGPITSEPAQDRPPAPGPVAGDSCWRRDAVLLLLLLLAAGGIRAWLLGHTEVAARDSIGYIRYAWQLQQRPWREVLETSEQHPGYPVAILAAARVVRHFTAEPDCVTMQLSAQLANSAAGVLLVVPMFFLGRELFNRPVGFWATLLFQCLPASGRVLSDGLSEGLFLLFAASALWAGVRALRTGAPAGFGLAGLFGGLAYLTRPEGALVVAATGAVLLGAQTVRAWRWPWRRVLAGAACLGLATAAVAGPFVAVTGNLTTKPTAHRILESAGLDGTASPAGEKVPVVLGIWRPGRDAEGEAGLRWGVWALMLELVKACHYVAWLPGLFGLWGFRHRFREVPGAWVPALVCLALTVLLGRMAMVVGYLSDRHTLLILLCCMYAIAAGFLLLGEGLSSFLARRLRVASVRRLLTGTPGSCLLIGAMLAVALPKTLEPLHANRSGFRDVGFWLAEHAAPSDPVIDPYFWSHFYSGRVFTEGKPLTAPPGHQPRRYVVLEKARSEHVRLRLLPEAERLKEQGQLVYRWSGRRSNHRAEVFVYAVPPE